MPSDLLAERDVSEPPGAKHRSGLLGEVKKHRTTRSGSVRIFTDKVGITASSVVGFARLPEQISLYYYDMFARGALAKRMYVDRHLAWVLDGALAGVVGVDLGRWGMCVRFNAVAPSTRYPGLEDLLLMCVTSTYFQRQLMEWHKDLVWPLGEFTGRSYQECLSEWLCQRN